METVSLLIESTEYGFWPEVEITRSLDTFDTVTFKAPFEPARAGFRETFRPFTYKDLDVNVGGDRLFTGTMVGIDPQGEPDSTILDVSGYALPGVLSDCTPRGTSVPREFKKLKLKSIAQALAEPFGLSVEFRADEGARFDKAKLEEDGKIFAFLTELAKQRNLIFSNTPEGVLLCWQSVQTGKPVARLKEGESPVSGLAASFDPQNYFSEITGFASAKRGRKGSKYTEQNKWLPGKLRPLSFKIDDTEKGDAPAAVKAKLGRMFANSAAYQLTNLPTWRDPKGRLYEPNTTIMLKAPSLMVYRETELLIRSVIYRQTAESESADLELVLPGAFSGEIPEVLPWDD